MSAVATEIGPCASRCGRQAFLRPVDCSSQWRYGVLSRLFSVGEDSPCLRLGSAWLVHHGVRMYVYLIGVIFVAVACKDPAVLTAISWQTTTATNAGSLRDAWPWLRADTCELRSLKLLFHRASARQFFYPQGGCRWDVAASARALVHSLLWVQTQPCTALTP